MNRNADPRARIESRVTAIPGIHFNALVRDLDLAPGQVQYHLRALCGTRSVTEEHLYGKTHYYPPGYDAGERKRLALARRETTRDVLTYLFERGSARPTAITDHVDIARSTLEWHLGRLTEQGLVEKRYGSQGRVRLVLTEPDEVARLLDEVSPSVPDRMADRFARLTDRLLSDADTNE